MTFKDPWVLFFIPVVLLVVFFFNKGQKDAAFRFSSIQLFEGMSHSFKFHAFKALKVLRYGILILFMISLSGPRLVSEEVIHQTEGIDIVLAIDASGSMAAEDFVLKNERVNRLQVVKEVVKGFIEERRSDRISLVSFSGKAYTVCPLTTDQGWLIENLQRIELGQIEDGTAIGSAIMSSLARFEDSKAVSKVVVLLTDGINNAGKVDPLKAARAAQAMGVKVYTVGAGTKGAVPFPVKDMFGRTGYRKVVIDMDENSLHEIARLTGGEYFRAQDTKGLQDVYNRINDLEKTTIEEYGYFNYTELFAKFLALALCLLLLEVVLSQTILMKIP